MEPPGSSPDALREQLHDEITKRARVLRGTGIEAD
jgi:hypothetical protein